MAGLKNRHTEESKETLGKVIASNLFSLLKIFLVCFVLVYSVVNFGVKPVKVYGGSMYPTLKDGSFALSNAFKGRFLDIERYDIVVAYDPAITKSAMTIIKRVIALPGESVYAKDDVVYVNGKPLKEPYIADKNNNFAKTTRELEGNFTDDFGPYTLKEDEYFLMGDSRKLSDDSRTFGPFKRSSIKASGIFVLIAGKL